MNTIKLHFCESCQKTIQKKYKKNHEKTNNHLFRVKIHSNEFHYCTQYNVYLRKPKDFNVLKNNDIKNLLINKLKEKGLINIIDLYMPKNEKYIEIYNKTTIRKLKKVLYAFKMFQNDRKANIIKRLINNKIFLNKIQIELLQ